MQCITGGVFAFNYNVLQICVPIFFIISGYLYFFNIGKLTAREYVIKSKKRVRSLLIPYLLWNLCYAVFNLGILLINGEQVPSGFDFIKGFWAYGNTSPSGFTSPYNGPFWFLRDLIVMSVVSPFIYLLLKNREYHIGTYVLIVLSVIYLFFPSYPIHGGISFVAVFFFSVGSYFGIRKTNLTTFFKGNVLLYVAVWLFLIIMSVTSKDSNVYEYVKKLQGIAGCITIFRLFPVLDSSRLHFLDKLYKSNFFIYAAHSLVSSILSYSIYKFFSLSPLTYYLLNPIVVFDLCCFLFIVLSFIMPKTLNLIVGRSYSTK